MREVDRALLFLRTLASLQPRQWAYLAIRKLQRSIAVPVQHKPIALSSHTDALAQAVLDFGPRHADFAARADRVLEGRFDFIGHEITLDLIDWRKRYVSHLWNYNLHYFDYALDLAWAWRATRDPRYSSRFVVLARDWIVGSSSGSGDGWQAYPIATRAVNWLYAILLLRETLSTEDRSVLLESVHSQFLALERRIEWHLLANHLQRNLQALAVGSLVFAGRDADRWRQKWLPRFWHEVSNQVLADGGHFERSPMYHAIAMADFLETERLARAAGETIPSQASERLALMLPALRAMSRKDGRLHLFNDSANGIAPTVAYLARLAGEGELHREAGSISLPDTGYFGFENDNWRLLIDCGEPGPAYQPGHAHCDLLSFELDISGISLIVDSGVCGYEGDPLRDYVRSTRAHNTIMIDESEQHEVWGTFRMGRRARVIDSTQRYADARYEFIGSYQPYHPPDITHTRGFEYAGRTLSVTDRLHGGAVKRVQSFLHFAPDVTVELDAQRAIARVGDIRAGIAFFGFDRLEVVSGKREPAQGWHCPEFGRAIPSACVVATVRAASGAPFGFTLQASR